jgi:MFS family permease
LNFAITSLSVLIVGQIGDLFGLRTALLSSAVVMLVGLPFAFLLPRDARSV